MPVNALIGLRAEVLFSNTLSLAVGVECSIRWRHSEVPSTSQQFSSWGAFCLNAKDCYK